MEQQKGEYERAIEREGNSVALLVFWHFQKPNMMSLHVRLGVEEKTQWNKWATNMAKEMVYRGEKSYCLLQES